MQTSNQTQEWGAFAKQCAQDAGELIERMLAGPLEVMYKSSASDLVTSVDRAVEQLITDAILQAYPDHGILGEEGIVTCNPAEFDTVWIIDPIDGTTNFVHQQLNYCVSIAVCHQGVCELGVVYDPTRNELFYAERGVGAFLNEARLAPPRTIKMHEMIFSTSLFWNRRAMQSGLSERAQRLAQRVRGTRVYGVAALELAYVAAGRLDAYLSLGLNPWDYAAGRLLIEEAGSIITQIDGTDIPFAARSSILAVNPYLYKSVLEFLETRPV
ncbi:myo-inositol-1(or 4)-monophosphatase [Aneurinibacillus soli]|uniref:Inositol-1-monophosphatase n=1 Tax=Aneurinibacillus soli TaxID=1500254 RepID=A0A0U5BGJ5_9BACL|nr:inositol monophosphatase family protein [Aneurinibacillus soli]PYE59879.1 myo-inositol-1(or 4)-monophosphatase [Aneurinibacillus soli]BAU29399.1 Inositol-1-monophosphatase [Aneurinibacillus soli]